MTKAYQVLMAILCFTSISFAGEYFELSNAFSKTERDPKTVQVSVIDSATSTDLFRRFAEDPEIAFRYPLNGCYVRASQMALIAERQGISVAKIYVHGRLGALTKNPIYPRVRWAWHVAPVAFVKNEVSEIPELMVFDPSLASEPLSVENFEKLLSHQFPEDSPSKRSEVKFHYFSSRFQFLENWQTEENKTNWSSDDLDKVQGYSKYYLRFQDHPELIDKNGQDYKLNFQWIRFPVLQTTP